MGKSKNKNKQIVKNEPQSTPKIKPVTFNNKFKDSIKNVKRYPEFNQSELDTALELLATGKRLNDIDPGYRDHNLAGHSTGVYKGAKEFHLRGNLVVVYRMNDDTIDVIDIGKHNKTRMTSSLQR